MVEDAVGDIPVCVGEGKQSQKGSLENLAAAAAAAAAYKHQLWLVEQGTRGVGGFVKGVAMVAADAISVLDTALESDEHTAAMAEGSYRLSLCRYRHRYESWRCVTGVLETCPKVSAFVAAAFVAAEVPSALVPNVAAYWH